ncbi:hypothetical protein RhiirA1_399986 [Rhizophagus irregularis]|uniref:Uncharacterized protein n=1 Tax=Rhizophagus irregularis TaxID=588596 RepID=A0A2N0R7X2_9GLOM|nr:hypothetical protein RhiirA1_399986 [Rhizophagus irregularis]
MDLANIIRYFKGNLAKITVFSAKITACPTGGQQAKFSFLEVCVTSRDNWPMGEMLHKYLGFGMGFGIWDGMGFGIGIWDGMWIWDGRGGDGRGWEGILNGRQV